MSYLTFKLIGGSNSGITRIWDVLGSDQSVLGRIKWHGPWRKYVFESQGSPIFDADCLEEIAAFSRASTQEHKNNRVRRIENPSMIF